MLPVFSIFIKNLECMHGCNIENYPAGSTREDAFRDHEPAISPQNLFNFQEHVQKSTNFEIII